MKTLGMISSSQDSIAGDDEKLKELFGATGVIILIRFIQRLRLRARLRLGLGKTRHATHLRAGANLVFSAD
jgi:hypothetical protein